MREGAEAVHAVRTARSAVVDPAKRQVWVHEVQDSVIYTSAASGGACVRVHDRLLSLSIVGLETHVVAIPATSIVGNKKFLRAVNSGFREPPRLLSSSIEFSSSNRH